MLASGYYAICNGHILHMRKLRFKEVNKVAHGHTATRRRARVWTKVYISHKACMLDYDVIPVLSSVFSLLSTLNQ